MSSILRSALFLLGSCVLLASCSDEKHPVQRYGTTMTQSYKSARTLDSKGNVQQVRKSIQEFHAANGRYPANLDELAAFNRLTLKHDDYDYDPTNGNLVEKQ